MQTTRDTEELAQGLSSALSNEVSHSYPVNHPFRVAKSAAYLTPSERPIVRHTGLGLADDFENRASVGLGEMPELWTSIFAAQHIKEPLVDALAHRRRHRIKDLAIDHVGSIHCPS